MSYVVLARKWRPTQFDEVVGQGHVARTLKNAIEQDRVHHAFLFTGARGVGKTSTARILAKALNCEQGPTPTPCGECSSCKEVASGQAVDVFEIDGASNRGINEIRELRESVRYAPSRDRYKIYIIDEVHMLTTEAFNALLKTLEEPPPHAKFIFATTEPQKIPVTILSRCQRYDFKRIGQTDIVSHLQNLCEQEEIEAEKTALQIIARQAAGGMRDALSILDQIISFAGTKVTEEDVNEILGVANRKHLFELSAAVLEKDVEKALLVLDEVNRYGYDLQQFASELVTHFRDMMVVSVVTEPEKVSNLTDSEIVSAREQVKGVDSSLLHRQFEVMAKGAQEMGRSGYPKLIFEMTLVRLARLEPLVGLDLMVDRLEALEKEFDGDPPDAGVGATPYVAVGEPRRKENHNPPAAENESHPEPTPSRAEPRETNVAPDPAREKLHSEPPTHGVTASRAAPHRESAEPEPVEAAYEPEQPQIEDPAVENAREPIESSAPDAVVENAREPREPDEAFDEPAAGAGAPESIDAVELPRDADEPSEPVDEEPTAELVLPEALDPAETASLSPNERWEGVVSAVREYSKPLAATCEHAYVERFEEGTIELSFADKYLAFIHDDDRLETVEKFVKALYGESWRVEIQTRDEEKGVDTATLADEREAVLAQKRQNLEKELLEHPVLKEAKELFEVDDDKVRVQVKLFEDP